MCRNDEESQRPSDGWWTVTSSGGTEADVARPADELSLAVHRIFTASKDMLLFDGEDGHPATPLCHADGLAKAFTMRGLTRRRRVVAVIGVDALSSGLGWEALNSIGAAPARPVVVVLHDDGEAYTPAQGGLTRHLAELKRAAAGLTGSRIPVQRQGKPLRNNLFTDLGFVYIGPVDGRDTDALERALRRAATVGRPALVHCVTRAGHRHAGSGAIPTQSAPKRRRTRARRTWASVFESELAAIGETREDVVCVTAGTGVGAFAARFPGRAFDVGTAEPHAIGSAAGLALGGAHPVVTVRADALTRAFDRLLADVARQRLPVTVALDHAGMADQGGHGMWDPAALATVPGLRLAAPRDTVRLRELLRQAVERDTGPTVLRFPPGAAPLDVPAVRSLGSCDVLREEAEPDLVLVATGALAQPCVAAAESLAPHGIDVTVLDPRWTVPVDPALIKLLAPHRMGVVAEEATAIGGLGARLAQALAAAGSGTRVVTHALPPRFPLPASRDELLRACSLDATGIAHVVCTLLGRG